MSLVNYLVEARGILNDYKEGAITREQAKVFLIFLGFPWDDAETLVGEEDNRNKETESEESQTVVFNDFELTASGELSTEAKEKIVRIQTGFEI